MQMYKHALLMLSDETDGQFLLQSVARGFHEQGTVITLGHLTSDLQELDITSDSLTKDRQSAEIIAAKTMLSRLVKTVNFPVDVKEIVTISRFKDVEAYVADAGVDLVIMGHKNRLFGMLSSHSIEFVNHLTVDVLIKHIATN
ncbi:universal stress protein [Serratia fonticola]|jgi:nucleotide-binding universal stress UspA family protein|uniref:universal stress protein n=1 Tax=Serratia fonticola TaxID=47917 RepID=UPI0016480E81|nr:universal stress protein [Serratia fonticola]MBC3220275.1 universal stress protein [Serratia fonticola]